MRLLVKSWRTLIQSNDHEIVYVHDKHHLIEGNYSICIYEHLANKKIENARVNYEVHSFKHVPFGWRLNFVLEVLQMNCDDLDSFPTPYGVCMNTWSGLIMAGSPWRPTAAELNFVLEVWGLRCDFVILVLQIMCECLDNLHMIYVRCLHQNFDWFHFPTQNSIATCLKWQK